MLPALGVSNSLSDMNDAESERARNCSTYVQQTTDSNFLDFITALIVMQ